MLGDTVPDFGDEPVLAQNWLAAYILFEFFERIELPEVMLVDVDLHLFRRGGMLFHSSVVSERGGIAR